MAESVRSHERPGPVIAGLGLAQIASWGTLYYSFPLIAEPMAASLNLTKVEVYSAASVGLAAGAIATFPVGRLVDRGFGRQVLGGGGLAGALLLALWSGVDGVAQLLPLFVAIGFAQACTLYEPAFAVLARRYGADARDAITQLTLWGGFASTVFVPVTQQLVEHFGWRAALLGLSGLQLLMAALPNWVVLRQERRAAPMRTAPATSSRALVGWALRQPAFWALLVVFTGYAAAFSMLSLHLYPLLLENGAPAAVAVAAMALIGPAQVAGRLWLWKLGHEWSLRTIGTAAMLALVASLALLAAGAAGAVSLAAFALLYGTAAGIMTIVRGMAVPDLLSREHYGALNGLLIAPAVIAKALAPVAGAVLWSLGDDYTRVLTALFVLALIVLAAFLAAIATAPAAPRTATPGSGGP